MSRGLPHILAQLVDAASLQRVLAFAEAYGGRRLSIRKRFGDDHPVVQVLGRAGADHLSALYGGSPIVVPFGPAGTLAAARRKMAQALHAGAPIDQAAAAAGMHRRTAARMRRAMKDPRQGDLF